MSALFLVWGLLSNSTAMAESLSLGFCDTPREINYLSSHEALADLVKSAVTSTLVGLAPAQDLVGFTLRLSDNVSVSEDQRRWSFRIRPGAILQNGELITPEDVEYSLDRCRTLTNTSEIVVVKGSHRGEGLAHGENWVDIELASAGEMARHHVAAFLADCPIIDKESSLIFDEDLGTGNSLISSGPYSIVSFDPGREVTLHRTQRMRSGGAEQIVLRIFQDHAAALTALRTGGIAALFDPREVILKKAARDETLLISKCSDHMVISRKGFEMPCSPSISIPEFRFVG